MYEVGLAKTFCTLTFVNAVTDQVAVRCLGKLLKLWRDQWGEFSLLWVAERQNDNKKYPGNIHFHLVLDREVDIKKENARWTRLQYNSGIVYNVDKAGQNFVLDPTYLSNDTIAKYVNPFDIDYIKTSQGLKNYLAGYVTKSIGDIFKCRVWHCSRSVSRLATEIMTSPDIHRDLLQAIPGYKNTYVYKKDVVNKKSGKVIRKAGDIILPIDSCNDYCSWVYIVNVEYCKQFTDLITEVNRGILNGIYDTTHEFIFYDYTGYSREFLSVKDMSYKMYKRIAHNYRDTDSRSRYDIETKNIDPETDFYQYAKGNKSVGYWAVYTHQPYINKLGQRYYNNKLFEPNKFLKETKNYSYAN